MTLNVYVDAFNLYYGCLKGTQYKWLDIAAMCRLAFPADTIQRVRIFTARVKPTPQDPSQHTRQDAYFRALTTTPGLTLHLGHFLESRTRMGNPNPPPPTLEVLKREEKGSDVNLATYLLLDAFDGDSEGAVVVSNDSDLAEPVRIVRDRFHLHITVLHPLRSRRPRSRQLADAATASVPINPAWLADAQFPPLLQDAIGTIHRPASW
ncbi:MAG TPA: NYN domain-containing protein [Armatimonadota bacterium]|jgi:uncharacterized LabA/DUF88 family protein